MAKKTRKAEQKTAKDVLEKVSKGRGFINITHQVLSRDDPKMLELTHQLFMHVMHERKALSLKVKELLIMAVNAALLYHTGTRAHIDRGGFLACGDTCIAYLPADLRGSDGGNQTGQVNTLKAAARLWWM